MTNASQPQIIYDTQKYIDYQSIESGTLLNIKLNQIDGHLLLETHQEVWSPTPFAIQIGELIAGDNCINKIIMDFASGSGFLSVIAGKKKAAKVIAIDINPKAITMTKRNWALNNLNQEQLDAIESDCFNTLIGNHEIEGQIDIIYSNPPTVPETKINKLSAGDWNMNGKNGRIVNDALITQGRRFLKPGGEIFFITTSKQGSKLTYELLNQHWGKGIWAEGNDPLDYQIEWQQRGDANWVVVKRVDLLLSDYYLPFLPQIQQIAQEQQQPAPIFEKEGQLYQKMYFIRAQKVV